MTEQSINSILVTQQWVLICITLVYVIATVLICIFNYRSAKSTREQVQEAKRQYVEQNRARITITLIPPMLSSELLIIENQGLRIARNVKVHIPENSFAFLSELDREHLFLLNNFSFSLGISQRLGLAICDAKEFGNADVGECDFEIMYSDSFGDYKETIHINLSDFQALPFFIMPENKAADRLLEIKSQLVQINKTLKEKNGN